VNKYSVKAVHTFHGHDGYGWECNLYNEQNKKVAKVVEDGWGGDLNFYWTDTALPRIETDGVDWQDAPIKYKDTPAQSELRTHCLTLPKWDCNGEMVHTSMDIYVTDLVNEALELKELKKALKKIVVLEDGKIYTYNTPPSRVNVWTLRRRLEKKQRHAIFLNDMPLPEALAIWKTVFRPLLLRDNA
tara:strand:+ start:672 stop:1232 length:561 start_codon:yes stop_codon:yes gene_type:complete